MMKEVVDLLFPRYCPVCEKRLWRNEKFICTGCMANMPFSYFWNWRENPVYNMLSQLCEIENAATLMIYRKESGYSALLHNIKYKGHRRLGFFLGISAGKKLAQYPEYYDHIDLIIPVPLHPLKKWKRGYNQSEIIARGVSVSLGIPVETYFLSRCRYTRTQTKKDKVSRCANVRGAFRVRKPEEVRGRHILLIDDVITTGATTAECVRTLRESEECKVSVLSLAYVE